MQMRPARRSDCKTSPLPAARARLRFERSFAAEDYARIALGIVPQQMEDKWFIFLDGSWLYFHRSWTGKCIYALELVAEGDSHRVEAAWVNRDPVEYTATDDEHDARLLAFLVDRLLLGRNVAFPAAREAREGVHAAVHRHHVVGYGRANDED